MNSAREATEAYFEPVRIAWKFFKTWLIGIEGSVLKDNDQSSRQQKKTAVQRDEYLEYLKGIQLFQSNLEKQQEKHSKRLDELFEEVHKLIKGSTQSNPTRRGRPTSEKF